MIITFDGITDEALDAIIDRFNNAHHAKSPFGISREEAAALARHDAERKAEKDRAIKEELKKFKELIHEAKAGKNDLKPNGGYIKINRFAFQMTQEVWDQIA
jgi:hypothetical protein